MFQLRPAVFGSPPSSPTPSPSPSPFPSSRSHTHIPPRSRHTDVGFQYNSRPLVPVTIQPSPVLAGIQQGSARLPLALHLATNTPPTPASTPVNINTHTNTVFRYGSGLLNPITIPVHVQVPPRPHASLAGSGVPAASSNILQRSPPNARDRIHDRACREPLPTGQADEDTDEDARTSTVNSTASSLGAGLRAMWTEQMGTTLSGPSAPPSPPRLSRRAKGKWKETGPSPPPSPTDPTAELILGCSGITKEGNRDTKDDAKHRDGMNAANAHLLPSLRPIGPSCLHRSFRNHPMPAEALTRKASC